MFDKKLLDDLTERLTKVIPPQVLQFKKEIEKDIRAVLQSAFAKFDLVTRDEFDAQVKVLARTRKRLTELEKEIEVLEEKLKKYPPSSS
ncbi:MAG: accessory factor UbiK family protein [Gammaproteobacteria bacterium]|nr:accessory factor UbiK family protein [Gammaproteobacteria bacterium]